MPVGVVHHYRPCLLVPFALQPTFWLVECRGKRYRYSYRGAITSDMSADPVPLSDMPACTVQLYQTSLLGSFIQIHVFVKCFLIRQESWYVTNSPDMPTGKVRLPKVCKTYQLPAWTPSWIYQILSDSSAASLGCYKDDVCNSRISKISILHIIPWNLPVSGKIFLYFCDKLPLWRPFSLHSYFIFIFLVEA